MRFRHIGRSLAPAFLAAAMLCRAGDASVSDLRTTYSATLQDIERAATQHRQQAMDDYTAFLTASSRKAQTAGDFDGVMAFRAETTRLTAEKGIPDTPPAGLAPAILAAQDRYHDSVKAADTERVRAIVALAKQQVDRLTLLKKELTVKGDMEGALAAKQEADRVSQAPEVTAAQFELAAIESATIAAPTAAAETATEAGSDEAAQITRTCPRCNGTGRLPGLCPTCSGTGHCADCDGTGKRPSGMKGSLTKMMCLKCKGTGKCPDCGGTGKGGPPRICPDCNGLGKITVAAPPRSTVATTPSRTSGFSESDTAAAPIKASDLRSHASHASHGSSNKLDAQLDAYEQSVSSLLERYRTEEPEAADFGMVTANLQTYTGKLLKSDVLLSGNFPRIVRVVGNRGQLKSEGTGLFPYQLDVGLDAKRIFDKEGRGCPVTIVYGVVSKDNLTLFSITSP